MTEEEFLKKLKWTKIFCVVIGILMGLSLLVNISSGYYMNAILSIVMLIWLYLFYAFTKKKNIAGPILGIILAALYILQFSIVGIILGICILVDCIAMLKYIKENKQ